MKVLLSWLREFVDWDFSTEELCHRLTMAGFEVEAVEDFSANFSNVVVGEILEIHPHPNADRLSLCNVNVGKEILRIVCGAKNISIGNFVPVALDGAQLPGDKKITSSKIRGEFSQGMLCSKSELGFPSDIQGIWIFPESFPKGENIVDALKLQDMALVLNVTPNRPDALSIRGIAREIAAMTGQKIRAPQSDLKIDQKNSSKKMQIKIEAPDACPRYMGRIIQNVRIGSSPYWLKQRLERMGQRSINNVVDVTNLILLELGHPMHAFDLGKIQGNEILVCWGKPEEKLLTLDDIERPLNSSMLIIADKSRPIALAGIMGGKGTQVDENTQNIFLECAYFDPKTIRKTSKALLLSSESSYRFERGVDPMGLKEALDRACFLIQQVAGGVLDLEIQDVYPQKISFRKINFRPKRCQNILGAPISSNEMEQIFGKLDFQIEKQSNEIWSVQVPLYRPDLEREVDLIEEIVRIWGYEKVPAVSPVIQFDEKNQIFSHSHILQQCSKNILQGLGLSEAITYSFISPDYLKKAKVPVETAPSLINPVRQDLSHLRTSLIPNLLRSLALNEHHQNLNVRQFEIGSCFSIPREESAHLALAMMGKVGGPWKEEIDIDFFYLKGIVEEFFKILRLDKMKYQQGQNETFHPGRSAEIFLNENSVGWLGEIHPDISKKFDLKQKVYVAQIHLEKLLKASGENPRFSELPRYPGVTRDIALILDQQVTHDEVLKIIYQNAPSVLEAVKVFDVYQGSQVPQGKKSLAFSLCFRSLEGTLREEEVVTFESQIKSKLTENLGCQFR